MSGRTSGGRAERETGSQLLSGAGQGLPAPRLLATMNASRAAMRDCVPGRARPWTLSVLLCAGMSLGPPSTHAQDTVRVLSYNIRHGAGMDGRVDLERTADVIRALAPDVVLLQEVDSCTARTGGIDQARALAELAELPHYAFGRFMEYQGGAYGMAILSATPILEHWNHELPGGTEPRSALAARVQPSPSRSALVLVGIHLYRSEAERFEQARRIIDIGLEKTAPVLLVGDFNSQPGDAVMRLLAEWWTLPPKPSDARLTWPADAPRVEIDHAMYRPEESIEVIDYRAIDERVASDHRPVLLRVTVR